MRKLLLSLAALAVATPASAGTLVFNNGGNVSGNARTYSDGTVSASVTGLSFDKNGSFKAISLPGAWDQGLGVQSPGSYSAYADQQHTVDNSGYVDFLLLSFNTSVALDGATFNNAGWYNIYDTDASISFANYDFAAHGTTYNKVLNSTSSATTYLNGVIGALNANMFESTTTANYSSTRSFNPTLNTGTTWLIGASFANLDRKTDSFKLQNVKYQLPAVPDNGGVVPEPATWAMLILGMGFIGGAMRRRGAAMRKIRGSIAFA